MIVKKEKEMFLAGVLVLLALVLCACGKSGESHPADDGSQKQETGFTWQEQYDLGVRYLTEGRYEEAILAFEAAIAIDPKRADGYLGRGAAYVQSAQSGEMAENSDMDYLAMAWADYEKAAELDGANAAVYLGLAEVSVSQEDYEKALEILQQGLEKAGENQELLDRLEEIRELASAASGYNVYGGTEFILRHNFRAYEDMSTAEQAFIGQAVDAVVREDRDGLREVLSQVVAAAENGEEIYSYNFDARTIWNGYKIGICFSHEYRENGQLQDSVTVDLRPEEGMGYFCSLYSSPTIDPEKREYDTWWEYYDADSWASCFCIDWQWSGSMSYESVNSYRRLSEQGWVEDYSGTIEETGTMKNGLREGEFKRIFYSETVDAQWGNSASSLERVYFYRDGQLLEIDGEAVDVSGWCGLLDDGYNYPARLLDEQWQIDSIYW